MSKIKVQVDPNKCIGCGTCVALAGNTFRLNEQNISEVIDQTGDSDDDKLTAAQSCPVGAIKAVDSISGEVLWPKV
ncbi:ferredoxin [Patescibacteria group bacterium]|nr:ferredoxin [Patescibacteria group bacterium]MBU1868329.1 ferredoxin [Patescibacteria group bacterium]